MTRTICMSVDWALLAVLLSTGCAAGAVSEAEDVELATAGIEVARGEQQQDQASVQSPGLVLLRTNARWSSPHEVPVTRNARAKLALLSSSRAC